VQRLPDVADAEVALRRSRRSTIEEQRRARRDVDEEPTWKPPA
jgi:hypothetical protein